MKNVAVINLTRFGDQLQSQAALNALAGPDGENRLTLITLANFASSSVFLNKVSLCHPLPRDAFMEGVQDNWPQVAARLWRWRAELWERCKPQLVCNLTPTVPARLLARFIADGAPISGYGLDEFGFGTASPWAAFFQGSSRRREVSPFNLVDLFRAVTGQNQGREGDFKLLAPAADSPAALSMAGRLAGAEAGPGFVAFQLGASEERRRWPVESFAALGRDIWRATGHTPLLLGGGGEKDLAARYAAASAALDPATPHISLIGKTSLEELAAALTRSALLVSNDTGTMHLAAGLGRPVLGIFLATAQAWDTGPYLVGSCSVEPGLPCHPCPFGQKCPHDEKCRLAVSAAELSRLCLGFLRQGSWPARLDNTPPERERLWLARRDEYGFMDLDSLSGHEDEARTLWFREQRRFLRQFLDRDLDSYFNYAQSGAAFTLPSAEKEKLAAELRSLLGQLSLLLELGKMLEAKPIPLVRERFISALHKASAAFENSNYLISLGLLWQIEVQAKGDELAAALKLIGQYHSLVSSLSQLVAP